MNRLKWFYVTKTARRKYEWYNRVHSTEKSVCQAWWRVSWPCQSGTGWPALVAGSLSDPVQISSDWWCIWRIPVRPCHKIKYVDLYITSSWSTTSNTLLFSRKLALISASQPDSQASANTARPREMGWCTTRYACLLPSCRWYQIILLGDRGSRVWTTCLRLLRSSVAAGPRTRDS